MRVGNPLAATARPSRRTVRATALAALLVGVALLANGAVADPGVERVSAPDDGVPYGTHLDLEDRINASDPRTEPIPPGAEVTVVATQGFYPDDESAELVAVTRNGTVVYHNDTYGVYFDVDPVPGTRYTVEYVAAAAPSDCPDFAAARCTHNVIEQVNLSTGETRRLYGKTTPRIHATRSHDADRINETHRAVADIHRDSLRVVNVSSGETTWEWNATEIYDHSGATRPQDWTHLNDVEVLDDGTFMLSMRNQDEVVFVSREDGYLPNRTLGEDGDHEILFEQHNPDYVPAERGGPAIIVGDSENNRVVEYHWRGEVSTVDGRTRFGDGEWVRAWTWRDTRMQWPRDADRLPSGRTLLVDSNGDRLLEVSPNGSVAWAVEVGMPYDAERLGTGDESAGGRPVPEAYEGSVVSSGPVDRALLSVKKLLPNRLVNGALFSASAVGAEWFGFVDLLVVGAMLLVLLAWLAAEYCWASWSVAGLARDAYGRVASR